MKAIIVYESKFGNSKRVATDIAAGMTEAGAEAFAVYVKEIDASKVAPYDLVVVGSPERAGRPMKAARKFLESLAGVSMEGKTVAFFETYGFAPAPGGKAIERLVEMARKYVPQARLLTSGLSIRVRGTKGPILEDEVPRAREFGNKLARGEVA